MEDGSHEVDYPERGRYEGEFKDGKPHGQGIMKYANGDVYDGRWAADCKSGKGTMKYANGDVYDGYWMDDRRYFSDTIRDMFGCKRSDRSIMKYANGDVYDGEWAADEKEGRGKEEDTAGAAYPRRRPPPSVKGGRLSENGRRLAPRGSRRLGRTASPEGGRRRWCPGQNWRRPRPPRGWRRLGRTHPRRLPPRPVANAAGQRTRTTRGGRASAGRRRTS